ncbi:hypothetical protein D9M68_464810 [compost metagenome]
MEARAYAVLFELNARAVSFDDFRAGSYKQAFYSGPLNGSRDRISEHSREGLFLLAVHASKHSGACYFCKRYFRCHYEYSEYRWSRWLVLPTNAVKSATDFSRAKNSDSGLNLVVSAIVHWNTIYLSRAVVTSVRAAGSFLTPAQTCVSPLSWEHINLTGISSRDDWGRLLEGAKFYLSDLDVNCLDVDCRFPLRPAFFGEN